MIVGSAQLTEATQALIDARLDTIDRMLLGRVPRQDRLAIVREVEGQIHELLQDRDGEELSREDVLAVLGRLDPPEAYLPDDETRMVAPSRVRATVATNTVLRPDRSRRARVAGILGLVGLGITLITPVIYIVTALTESEAVMIVGVFGSLFTSFVCGALGIILASFARLRGAWAVVGLVLGIFAILTDLAAGAYLTLLMMQ